MKKLIRSAVVVYRISDSCLKARCLATASSQSFIRKRRPYQDVRMKESISKGPTETFLKAFSKEHPALHGITAHNRHTPDFENLGLRKDLCDALKTMNIDLPTGIQIQSIPKILNGHSVLCTSQTGSGKTLAYLLPIINLLKNQEDIEEIVSRSSRPRACIVVPFRELAVQILGVVKYLSHFTKLRSLGLISGRKKKWIREGLYEPVDIVVATPHVLLQYLQKGDVFLSDLSHLAIDEADTMFDPSFVSMAVEILKYAGLKFWSESEHPIQTTFVTTTVPHGMLKMLNNMIPNLSICNSGLHQVLPHVSQKFVKVSQHKKSGLLLDIVSRELRQEQSKQMMVFCNTTKSCDWTSYFLEEQGISQIRLNGNMPKKERRLHLERFKEKQAPVLVCTDVASRGLDTTNVFHVINFDFPVGVVDYIHRAGRTGRLGTTLMSSPQVTSFLSHNRELVIMEQIKKAMQQKIPLEDASLWQTEKRTK
ncbi:DEAD-box ATP-dependent RNA helicase 39-like isoform X2 [Paramuricea clavata]|uniref:DEAD-box ATP-dependent RNA helicase 39-like isoform X2 n=1 Tax=Paramuricea clavata TaxID=317549 RepID=A0A6S7GQR3_PARCT|nr:DEAD-box ATP-dependent RNA helicase 39-like isoform X2 [Paramuricea clavata]CAB3986952.1 DEAD-box ATP-dependent RNA helicase 39-like isoform X2 [Paramuricea clavata]